MLYFKHTAAIKNVLVKLLGVEKVVKLMHVHVSSWFWKHVSFFRNAQQTSMWPLRDSHSIKAHKIFKKSDPVRSTRKAHQCLKRFFILVSVMLTFPEDQVHAPVNHQARKTWFLLLKLFKFLPLLSKYYLLSCIIDSDFMPHHFWYLYFCIKN